MIVASVLTLGFAGGCESSVLVEVSAPLAVPSEVDAIAVALTSSDGSQTQRFSVDALAPGSALLESFLVRRGNETEDTGTLSVTLKLDDATIASQAEDVTFPGFGYTEMAFSFSDDALVADGGVVDGG